MHQVCARERRHIHFKMVEGSRLLESAFGMQEHRSWEFRWLVYLSIYVFPLRDCECACVCALSVRVHVRGWPRKPLIWSVVLIVEGMGLSLAWGLSIRLIHVYTSPMLGLQTHVNTPGFLKWVWGIQIRPPCLRGKHFTDWTSNWDSHPAQFSISLLSSAVVQKLPDQTGLSVPFKPITNYM